MGLFLSLSLVTLGGAYAAGFIRARRIGHNTRLHSRPAYHGAFLALHALGYVAFAGCVLWFGGVWLYVVSVLVGLGGLAVASSRLSAGLMARLHVERFVSVVMVLMAGVSILTTAGVVLSLLFETVRFFTLVSPVEFLFGLEWSPHTALRADQVGAAGVFGAIPLLTGALLITGVALVVAAPLGLFSAIYMSEYAAARWRGWIKPCIEVLAGVPTIVYGFFAALLVAPVIRDVAMAVGLEASSESALAAGIVMGIMIIPIISSVSDDALRAVPDALREGSYALGATRSETVRRVVVPAALAGIGSAFLLAISRALGETMIVVMAAGLAANLTFNPLEAVTTVTVQIVTLLTGDQEFDSAKTLAAFALGTLLFVITLVLNVASLVLVRRYREQYE